MAEEVDRALGVLKSEFRTGGSLFFTEDDITSRAYHLVQEHLGYPAIRGVNGERFHLVHREYPTPFRCDMRRSRFRQVSDSERTPKGGLFRRGHYDLVIFDPQFLELCEFDIANGQDYDHLSEALPGLSRNFAGAPIVYGIELSYKRRRFVTQNNFETWSKKTRQDLEKLRASRTLQSRPFIGRIQFLAFVRDSRPEFEATANERFGGRGDFDFVRTEKDGI